MNIKNIRNKAYVMAHGINHKKLYKSGKLWLVGSATLLALMGGANAISHQSVHAANVDQPNVTAKAKTSQIKANPHASNSAYTVKSSTPSSVASQSNNNNRNNFQIKSIATNNVSNSNIQSSANNLHSKLINSKVGSALVGNNSRENSARIFSNEPSNLKISSNKLGSASNSDSNASTPNYIEDHAHYNLGSYNARKPQSTENQKEAYANYLKVNPQLANLYNETANQSSSNSVANSKVASNAPKDNVSASSIGSNSSASSVSANNSKVSSANQISDKKNKQVTKLSQKHNLGDSSGIQTGTYYGLSYKFNPNTESLEFTGGTLNWNSKNDTDATMNIFIGLDGSGENYAPNGITANKLKSIKFDSNVDISQVTNMSGMFFDDSALQSLDVSHFDTSKVTNMFDMFKGNSALQSLDVSHFDTSKVTNMGGMFWSDSALQSLDVSHFDTSKVTNMEGMFKSDSALQNLDVSHFDTSNVTDMGVMFGGNFNVILGNNFNTQEASQASDSDGFGYKYNGLFSMFHGIQSLTIQSPNTKFNNQSGLSNMYKKDSNDSYTSAIPNDFTKGNVGTFVKTPNPKPDTIIYQSNGKTVGTQSNMTSKLNSKTGYYSDINATNIPSGYHLVNGTTTSFTFGGGATHYVQVVSNSVTTNGQFNYTNQKGSNVNQYTPNRAVSISGTPNVSQNVESQADNDKPNGYSLKSNDPIEMDNNQSDQTINVNVVGNNISDKPISITINKYDNGNYVGQDSATYHTGQGETGNTFTINPNNYNPAGYKASSSPVNDIFVPNGVQTSSYTFNYNAQQGTPINVNYLNQHGQNVGSGKITGNVDDSGNATQKVAVPSNYNLNNGQNLNYHITTNSQTINLNVTGKPATVKFDFNNQHGNHVGSDTVDAKVGDTVQPNSYPEGYTPNPTPSYTISNPGSNTAPTANVQGKLASQDNGSGNYTPKSDSNDINNNTAKGYATVETVKYSSGQLVSDSFKTYDENNVDTGDSYKITPPSIANYTANANQSLTGTVKSGGSLSNGYAKFIYQANHDNSQISVQYKNQDGNIVATGSVSGTYDEKGTINSLPTTNNIDNNYTLNNNVNYQINHTQSPLVVGVTGKPANATINFTNQNGKSEGHTTVNGKVGDTVSPSSSQYPQGYQPNPAPSYTFNNAGNNTAITAHVKGESASTLNGSNNYTPKSDKNDITNNAKHGYDTVETVKYSSGQLVSDSYKTFNENNVQVGNSFTLSPQNITNYTTTDKSVTDTVNPNGSLSNNGFAKFVYNANKDNNPIHVQYINQDGTKIYSDNISGTYDEKGTITNLPSANGTNANYTLNNNVPYQFETDSNPLNVAITGKPANATINFSNQTGDNAGSEQVNGRAGDTVSPSQYPSGYVKPNPSTTYHFNTAGTNPDMDNVVIHGATASDLNGSKEYNPYTPNANGSTTDPTTDTNNPLNPNSSKNNHDDKYNADHGYATINVVQYINGKIVKETAHVINENPSHSVGDHYSIDPENNSLLPYGYKPSTTTTGLNGTIQPNGSLSNGTATFNYVVDPSMIKPIKATFYNQNGATVDIHTGDDSATNDTEFINSNQLATLGPVGASVNVMKFLTAPYGYHFTQNEVATVTLQQKTKGFGVMLLAVHMPGKQDLANMAINNDSAEANNDLNIAHTFVNKSDISSSVKNDINKDISTITNDSSEIHRDVNGGYASEANANGAYDNAASAYNNAYSEYANGVNNYTKSVDASNMVQASQAAASNMDNSNRMMTNQFINNSVSASNAIAKEADVNNNNQNTISSLTNKINSNNANIEIKNNSGANHQSSNSQWIPRNPISDKSHHNLKNVSRKGLINLRFGTLAKYNGYKVSRVSLKGIRYFKVYKAILLHTDPMSVGRARNYKGRITPRMRLTLTVTKAFKLVRNHHVYYRYLLNFNHHDYFITANPKFVRNAYLPLTHRMNHRHVHVFRTVFEYKHVDHDMKLVLRKGHTVKIRRIKKLGKYNRTRVQLSNGNWITANLNFISVI